MPRFTPFGDKHEVVSAYYGTKDVTSIFKHHAKHNKVFSSSNSIFGDPLEGTVKMLVITFRSKQGIKTKVIKEGGWYNDCTLSLKSTTDTVNNGVNVLCAFYGGKDVTNHMSSLVGTNYIFDVEICNDTFGVVADNPNSFFMLYRLLGKDEIKTVVCGNCKLRVMYGQCINVQSAYYGPLDVTDRVKSLVSNNQTHLSFVVSNNLFTDPLFGVLKTLTLDYVVNGSTESMRTLEHENVHIYVEGATKSVNFLISQLFNRVQSPALSDIVFKI
ncbi:lectin domain-containing protein [Acrasis kona]|uniref:Lectin domain-containing protein n=1 Tax=Acrasis kona TaxID=1008807 RepID=A0AAW2Z5F5_9EUKA